MKTAAVYCRVSSESQEDNTSLTTQEEACLTKAKELGYEVKYTFREIYSGLMLNRPKLEELRELIRGGQVDAVIAYEYGRVSRDPANFILVQSEIEKAGVELALCTEDLDNSDEGKLITHIKGYSAKLEALKIRERFLRGKNARLKEGKIPQGVGVGIYGYDWNKEQKKRVINLYEAEIVREIFERVATGEALIAIARDLNSRSVPTKATVIGNPEERKLWHSLTIRRIVRNQAYIGKTYFGMTSRISKSKILKHPEDKWISLPTASPQIVSEELYQLANQQLDKPKVRTGRAKHDYLLKHHAFCYICKRPLVGHCLGRKYRYYQCIATGPVENKRQICQAPLIRSNELEETVWEKVKEVLRNRQLVIAEIKKLRTEINGSFNNFEDEIRILEKKRKEYKKRRTNLLEAMELGEFEKDEILDRLNKLKLLTNENETKLKRLEDMRAHITSLENAHVKLDEIHKAVLENIENCADDVKKLALDALDIKAYASTDNVEIHGVLPLALPTTGQTSGCLFVRR
jgi:site-specific DNA recombinase